MKNNFKYTTLAVVIASTFSLAGCGSGSDNADNNSNSSNSSSTATSDEPRVEQGGGVVEQVPVIGENTSVSELPIGSENSIDMAQIKLAVKFPEAGASAAWIGDSKSIEVSFFNTEHIGTIAEAEKALDDNDCDNEPMDEYDNCRVDPNVLRGQFATSVMMDTNSPSAFLDLLPGKYRIEAKFSNEQGKLQETSVSYVTLSSGEHSLKLRGIEATWTATEQLDLQLLNQASETDWDLSADGVQTSAEVIGITGGIKGLHLPSVLTYPSGYLSFNKDYHDDEYDDDDDVGNQGDFPGVLINAGVTDSMQLTRESQATVFQPVLRIDDGNQGEYNLLPRFDENSTDVEDGNGEIVTRTDSWNATMLAVLQQEYSSEGDKANLSLGGYYLGRWQWDRETNTSTDYSAELLLGIPLDSEDDDNPLYSIEYTPQYGGKNGEDLTIVRVRTDDRTDTDQQWQQIFIDLQASPDNVLVDGSTITGFLIESERFETYVHGNPWEGIGADVTPTSFIEAALLEIAEDEGLMATAAADEACSTQEFSGTEYSNDYLWDEVQQGWVAGQFNPLFSDGGIVSQIDNELERNINEKNNADIESQQTLEELLIIDGQIITLIQEEQAVLNTTIQELDAYVLANADAINNYPIAWQEAQLANTDYNEKLTVYDDAALQVFSYNAGDLPNCDTACGDALIAAESTALSELGAAETLLGEKNDSREQAKTAYDPVEVYFSNIIDMYNLSGMLYLAEPQGLQLLDSELIKGELQANIDNLQVSIDAIDNFEQELLWDAGDNWQLVNDRSSKLYPYQDATRRLTELTDIMAQLEQIKIDTLLTADLNSDGEATIFEEGVYIPTGHISGYLNWSFQPDQTGKESIVYNVVIDDFEVSETVKASTSTGVQTICVQSFTLNASQLSITYETKADVLIE